MSPVYNTNIQSTVTLVCVCRAYHQGSALKVVLYNTADGMGRVGLCSKPHPSRNHSLQVDIPTSFMKSMLDYLNTDVARMTKGTISHKTRFFVPFQPFTLLLLSLVPRLSKGGGGEKESQGTKPNVIFGTPRFSV